MIARDEGWLAGETLATVAPAVRGAELLDVDSTSALSPGDMVLLEMADGPDANDRMLR